MQTKDKDEGQNVSKLYNEEQENNVDKGHNEDKEHNVDKGQNIDKGHNLLQIKDKMQTKDRNSEIELKMTKFTHIMMLYRYNVRVYSSPLGPSYCRGSSAP